MLQQLESLIHAFLRKNGYPIDRVALSYGLPTKAPTLTQRRATAALQALLHIDRARHAVFDRNAVSAAQDSLLAMTFVHDAIGGSALERWRQSAGGVARAARFEPIKRDVLRWAAELRATGIHEHDTQLADALHDRAGAKYPFDAPAVRTIRGWISTKNN